MPSQGFNHPFYTVTRPNTITRPTITTSPTTTTNRNSVIGGAVNSPNSGITNFSMGNSNIPITSENVATSNQNTQRTSSTSGQKDTAVTGQETTDQVRDLQTVTDPVLRALEQAIAQGGSNATLSAADEARRKTMEAVLAAIQGFDPAAIMQGAEGEVAGLTRELMENVLPQVTGAVEASGSSNNALGALLAQDAAARTGEAQARVREEARANAAREFSDLLGRSTAAAQGGSAVADNLVALINSAKGTVDRGTVNENRLYTENERAISSAQENMQEGTQTSAQQQVADSAVADALDSSGQDRLAALALLQSTLSPFQSLQDLVASPFQGSSPSSASANSAESVRALYELLEL